jgi:hypothetical protein
MRRGPAAPRYTLMQCPALQGGTTGKAAARLTLLFHSSFTSCRSGARARAAGRVPLSCSTGEHGSSASRHSSQPPARWPDGSCRSHAWLHGVVMQTLIAAPHNHASRDCSWMVTMVTDVQEIKAESGLQGPLSSVLQLSASPSDAHTQAATATADTAAGDGSTTTTTRCHLCGSTGRSPPPTLL